MYEKNENMKTPRGIVSEWGLYEDPDFVTSQAKMEVIGIRCKEPHMTMQIPSRADKCE